MIFVYQGLGANPSLDLYYAFLGDVFGIHAAEVFKQYPPHENNRTSEEKMIVLGKFDFQKKKKPNISFAHLVVAGNRFHHGLPCKVNKD